MQKRKEIFKATYQGPHGIHLNCLTEYTQFGERNMEDQRCWRTKDQRAEARQRARRDHDGAFRAMTPYQIGKRQPRTINPKARIE